MNQPDLLLLHGALGASDQFDPLLPLLKKIKKVHTLDFEGHGHASPQNRPYNTDYFVENVLDYMDDNRLAVVDLFGYSMGGYVGLCLARKHPERLRRIFTFATKFQWTPVTAEKETACLDPGRIEQKTAGFAQALKTRHAASGWKNVLLNTKEMILNLGQESFLTEESLRQIVHTTRLTMGDSDKMVSLEEITKTYRLLPNAQLQIFPSTTHPIEQASMEMLADAMIPFFTE